MTLTRRNRLPLRFAGIAVLLCIPLIAMQFTKDVVWAFSDFLIMGILLSITALGLEIVLRKVRKSSSRLILVGVVLFLFLLIWAEMAVGIFGTPISGS
jgi:uncharacterized membrane protein YadS